MSNEVKEGKRQVIRVIYLVLIASLIANFFIYYYSGSQRLAVQVVRFILTALSCFLIYKGYNLVRWILGITLALGALVSVIGIVQLFSEGKFSLVSILLGVIYGYCAMLLLFSKKVSAFFMS